MGSERSKNVFRQNISINKSYNYEQSFSAAKALQENSDYQSCIDDSISHMFTPGGMISLKKLLKH